MFLILISFHAFFVCCLLYCLNFFGQHWHCLHFFRLDWWERRTHQSLSKLRSLSSCYNGLGIILGRFYSVCCSGLEVLTSEWVIGLIVWIVGKRHVKAKVDFLIELPFLQTVLKTRLSKILSFNCNCVVVICILSFVNSLDEGCIDSCVDTTHMVCDNWHLSCYKRIMPLCFRVIAFGFIAALLVLVFFFLNFIVLLQRIFKGESISGLVLRMARRFDCFGTENFVQWGVLRYGALV